METIGKWGEKEYERKAAEVRDQYAYMDTMALEGWIWEFARRTEDYRREFQKFDDAAKSGLRDDELLSMVDSFFAKAAKAGLIIFKRQWGSYKETLACDGYVAVPVPVEKADNGKWKFRILEGSEIPYVFVPKPQSRFCDLTMKPFLPFRRPASFMSATFPPEGGGPVFKNAGYKGKGFRIYLSVGDLVDDTVINQGPDYVKIDNRIQRSVSNENNLKHVFDLTEDDRTIYLTISKDARYTDLKDSLLPAIRKFLRKPSPALKPKINRWKYYLINFDLKETYGKTIVDKDIGNILAKAYPKIKTDEGTVKNSFQFFRARNIPSHYKAACALINGAYKKYLFPRIFPTN